MSLNDIDALMLLHSSANQQTRLVYFAEYSNNGEVRAFCMSLIRLIVVHITSYKSVFMFLIDLDDDETIAVAIQTCPVDW